MSGFFLPKSVLVKILQRNGTNRRYIYEHTYLYIHEERENDLMICFKELAHAVMEAGKSKICMVSWQA